MKPLSVLAALLAIIGAAWATGPSVASTAAPAESLEVAQANRAFGLALYRKLAAEPGNVFISPISIAGAFGPVAAGAQGETRAAIGSALGFPGDDAVLHARLGGLLRGLESDRDGARVSIANALWLMQGFQVKPPFVAVARDSYDATVETLDFRNGQAAGARINRWVEKETNGRIKELIDADSLGEMTALVVTNAVHFLGDWTEPFNASNTRPQSFHLAGGTTREVPMMYGKRLHHYAEAGPVQLLELPYKGERLAMVAILPKERGGLAAVEAGLGDGQLGEWLTQLDAARPQTVQVHLPKVELKASYQLNQPLQELGMAVAFDPNRANFRGIADRELFISQVVHKTFLRIDEKGTEAAAATGIEMEVTSAPAVPPPTFRADHPFLVLIRDKPTGAILFMGRIAQP